MLNKYVAFAFCVTFILQVYAPRSAFALNPNGSVLPADYMSPPGVSSFAKDVGFGYSPAKSSSFRKQSSITLESIENEIPDEIVRTTIIEVVKQLKIMFRDENAGQMLKVISTNTRKIFNSKIGQENMMELLDLAAFILKDQNASEIISIICDNLVLLAKNPNGRAIVREAVIGLSAIFKHSKIIDVSKAFIDGLTQYTKATTPDRVVRTLNYLKKKKFKASNDDDMEKIKSERKEKRGQKRKAV